MWAAVPADQRVPLETPPDLAAGKQHLHHLRVDHRMAEALVIGLDPEGPVELLTLELEVGEAEGFSERAAEDALVGDLQPRQRTGQLHHHDAELVGSGPPTAFAVGRVGLVAVVEGNDLPALERTGQHVLHPPVVAGLERRTTPLVRQRVIRLGVAEALLCCEGGEGLAPLLRGQVVEVADPGADRDDHENDQNGGQEPSPSSSRPNTERFPRPSASIFCCAPVTRPTIPATATPSAPASRSASTAVRTEPPVVEVSSTASTRRPCTSGPSIRRCKPCALPSLRTTNASSLRPAAAAACSIAAATGSAPRVRPPTAS